MLGEFSAGIAVGQPRTLEIFCRRAEVVLVGEVKHTISLWTPDGSDIFTYVTLRVERTMKGRVERPAAFTFRVRGGRVGRIASVVPGAPVFEKGERVVLFLTAPDRAGFPRVLGLSRGVWKIHDNKVRPGEFRRGRPGPVRVTRPGGGSPRPVATAGSKGMRAEPLARLLGQIERQVAAAARAARRTR